MMDLILDAMAGATRLIFAIVEIAFKVTINVFVYVLYIMSLFRR